MLSFIRIYIVETCKQYVDEMHEKRRKGEPMPADMELPSCDVFGNYNIKQCYGAWTGMGK